jgi:hypothetical protein
MRRWPRRRKRPRKKATADTIARSWLNDLPLNASAHNLLLSCAGKQMIPIRFFKLAEMKRDSHDEMWKTVIDHDLLIIGNTMNGDAWAIDLKSKEVVILSHDRLATAEQRAQERLPYDWWEAKEMKLPKGK